MMSKRFFFSDDCGSMGVEWKSRAEYFIEINDDHSKWCEVRFIRSTSKIFQDIKLS